MKEFIVGAENARGRYMYFEVRAVDADKAVERVLAEFPVMNLSGAVAMDDADITPYMRENALFVGWSDAEADVFVASLTE